MTAFSFKQETILYSNEYAIVKEVERVWRRDLDEFHEAFFKLLSDQLEDMKSKHTASTYRYWWRNCWRQKSAVGLTLWHDLYYPNLIRDKTIEFFVFFNHAARWEGMHAILQAEADAVLSGIPGLEFDRGEPNSEKPLTLRVRWKEDALKEGVPVFADALRALDKIALFMVQQETLLPNT